MDRDLAFRALVELDGRGSRDLLAAVHRAHQVRALVRVDPDPGDPLLRLREEPLPQLVVLVVVDRPLAEVLQGDDPAVFAQLRRELPGVRLIEAGSLFDADDS